MNFSMGMMSRMGVKGERDADIVAQLKEAGGILLAVTNVPELNLWCETRCMVYGQTNNPYNLTRTVGGSSGGEVRHIENCYVASSNTIHLNTLILRKKIFLCRVLF